MRTREGGTEEGEGTASCKQGCIVDVVVVAAAVEVD